MVVRAEVDDEDVGHDGAAAAHDGGAVVHLALERGGDLDGLHLGLEGAREGTVDHAVEPLLEAVEQTHRASRVRQDGRRVGGCPHRASTAVGPDRNRASGSDRASRGRGARLVRIGHRRFGTASDLRVSLLRRARVAE